MFVYVACDSDSEALGGLLAALEGAGHLPLTKNDLAGLFAGELDACILLPPASPGAEAEFLAWVEKGCSGYIVCDLPVAPLSPRFQDLLRDSASVVHTTTQMIEHLGRKPGKGAGGFAKTASLMVKLVQTCGEHGQDRRESVRGLALALFTVISAELGGAPLSVHLKRRGPDIAIYYEGEEGVE